MADYHPSKAIPEGLLLLRAATKPGNSRKVPLMFETWGNCGIHLRKGTVIGQLEYVNDVSEGPTPEIVENIIAEIVNAEEGVSDIGLLPQDEKSIDIPQYRRELIKKLTKVREIVRENILKAQEKMKRNYDNYNQTKERAIEIGDLVLFYRDYKPGEQKTKFFTRWHGPYRVVFIKHPNVTLQPLDGRREPFTTHLNKTKLYHQEKALPLHRGDIPEPILPDSAQPEPQQPIQDNFDQEIRAEDENSENAENQQFNQEAAPYEPPLEEVGNNYEAPTDGENQRQPRNAKNKAISKIREWTNSRYA